MQKTCAVVCMTLFAFGASAQEKKPKIEPKLEIIEDEPSKPATIRGSDSVHVMADSLQLLNGCATWPLRPRWR